jgi:hypothetical protein
MKRSDLSHTPAAYNSNRLIASVLNRKDCFGQSPRNDVVVVVVG